MPWNVVIWSGEDDIDDTLVPRLEASGADLKRVFFAGGMTKGGLKRSFDPAIDFEALQAAIEKAGGASLIVIDPFVHATPADSHKNAETRRGLQPVVDIAVKLISLQTVPMFSHPDIRASVVAWGNRFDGNAREALAEAEDVPNKEKAGALQEAMGFLNNLLSDGPKSAKECKAAAAGCGFVLGHG